MDRKNDTLYRPIRSSDDRNTSVDGILLRRSPASRLFLNLLVLPLMNLFVPMALGAGGVSLLSISMAGFCGGTLHFILQINRFLCEKMLIMPFSVWRTGVPPSAWLLIDYGLMIGFALLALPEHKWFKHTDIGKILIKRVGC